MNQRIIAIVQNELPAKAAESVGRQSEAFTARVGEVETQIKSQQKITVDLAKSMQGLAGQVSSLRKQISSVDELNKDVQALVTLQRERYYEFTITGPKSECCRNQRGGIDSVPES